ncbi:MAG: 1-acyl-sn-glycerol-3-phosphate acyltransferase [Candidatus Improbicoccus devescovinae]|nr:MAG: 1-acyl-sn-glycerol-3-phosphate acyltransferase [Candidatus Improbicoccus devescovinae]
MIYKILLNLIKIFFKIFFPFSVYGANNTKNIKNGFILCSNHISNLDPLFILVSYGKKTYFLGKYELFKHKILSIFFKKVGVIPIKRGKNDQNALKETENILLNKKVVVIFIEGARSKTGEFLRPKSGAARIAQRVDVPIVPVCIIPNKKTGIKLFKNTKIIFGEPIVVSKLEFEKIHVISEYIMQRIINLKNEVII